MAELIWSEESLSDLEGIYDYIARDSPLYARYQIEGICKSTERLRQFPESGRRFPIYRIEKLLLIVIVWFIVMI